MQQEDLDRLYEKIHFHELEVKEKLSTRIQLAFAIIFTYYTVIAYMLRMLDYNESAVHIAHFLALISLSLIVSAPSTFFIIRAFWGNSYLWLCTANDINIYNQELEKHKLEIEAYNNTYQQDFPEHIQEVPNVPQRSRENIRKQFITCATQNSTVNEKRSHNIHYSFKWMLFSAIPFMIACVYFVALDLDVSSPRKASLVDNQPLIMELKEIKKALEGNVLSQPSRQ